jgi:hypothetical protein
LTGMLAVVYRHDDYEQKDKIYYHLKAFICDFDLKTVLV